MINGARDDNVKISATVTPFINIVVSTNEFGLQLYRTHLVRVLLVVIGELCRYPARDRVSDVLLCGDQDSEDDKQTCRVSSA